MIAKQTVFLTGDRSKAVPEGHPDAKFLLVREGSEIADAEAEKHNAVALIDTPAKKKAEAPQETPPPTIKEQVAPSSATADGKAEPVKAPKTKRGRKPKK